MSDPSDPTDGSYPDTGSIFGGLGETLAQVESFHPQTVIDALLRGTLDREGDVAVHLAAMLLFVHGAADSAFDWDQRPFVLRFGTDDRAERRTAFRDLCQRIGIDPTNSVAVGH